MGIPGFEDMPGDSVPEELKGGVSAETVGAMSTKMDDFYEAVDAYHLAQSDEEKARTVLMSGMKMLEEMSGIVLPILQRFVTPAKAAEAHPTLPPLLSTLIQQGAGLLPAQYQGLATALSGLIGVKV